MWPIRDDNNVITNVMTTKKGAKADKTGETLTFIFCKML